MTLSIGIVGAGITGRMTALMACARGWKVSLFDRGDEAGSSSCSYVSPAMLAPYCELDVTEKSVSDMGARALQRWPEIISEFSLDVFFQHAGSIVVAYPSDQAELDRFARSVKSRADEDVMQNVSRETLRDMEPDLDPRFQNGIYFPDEGQIDSRGALAAMADALRGRGVELHFETNIEFIRPHEILLNNKAMKFDMVLDCRGWGAAGDLKDLRAVRGEIIRVYAPDVKLNRPVRLMHPRWPIYIVPHPDHEYVIGASSIESDDGGAITLRSAAEMLNAAFAVSAGFSEARIMETSVGLRPAFPDNEPKIISENGLIRINGMYRHGFLLAPVIAEQACRQIETFAKRIAA